jgi:hypothetical protein
LRKVEWKEIEEALELGRIDRLLKATEDTELFGLFSVERRIGACDESDGSLGVAREVTNRGYKVRESEHGQDPSETMRSGGGFCWKNASASTPVVKRWTRAGTFISFKMT